MRYKHYIRFISLWCLSIQTLFTFAQLCIAPVFSDNMVLQRNRPMVIWGSGTPGSLVSCSFNTFSASTTVEKNGHWRLQLPPQKASITPKELRIQMGQESVVLNDILIGDVWLCIGQSNMEWPMSRELHWKQEQQEANSPIIRFKNPSPAGRYVYNVKFNDSLLQRLNEKDFYAWEGWQRTTPASVASMSAVAYYFAKRIQQDVDIPIGLINLSIGGAPLESFIGTDALLNDTLFEHKVKGNWLFNDALPVWIRQRGLQNLDSVPFKYGDAFGPNHAFKPGFAYKSGVVPLKDFPISGVLIYQGESNAEESVRVEEYGKLFALMVDQYRTIWSTPNLPFYWVQLSSIERPLWPSFRDEQRKLLDQIQHSGMAVTSDHGLRNDVHPPNKKVVGERLAGWALKEMYNQQIIPSGPLPVKATYKRKKVIVKFRYADGLKTSDDKPLREISIDGKNDMNAVIRRNKIIIPVEYKPQDIRYGWKPYSEGNLINSAGLPASTFKLKID